MWMRDIFIEWYNNVFKCTALYQNMEQTVEESPWHRERNVAVHTDMVVSQYLARSGGNFSIIGALACAFHDVGKPAVMQLRFREDRGDYKMFAGHEQVSARLWEAFVVEHWVAMRDTFCLQHQDIYNVGVFVEHHVPWNLKDKRKLDAVILTMEKVDSAASFADMLLSDTFGRISDDALEKQTKSHFWIDKEIGQRYGWDWEKESEDKKKIVYFPISASGGGKSTLFNNGGFSGVDHYSLDDLRLAWYPVKGTEISSDDTYAYAFSQACDDKRFRANAYKHYVDLLREGKDVYVDNTNTTRKARRFYITEAKNRGYKTIAFLFPSDVSTLVDRQFSRDDKTVPGDAVIKQYNSIQYPMYYGEFDEIVVVGRNISNE